MTLEDSLREISLGLTSNRANERKKNAENLKDFLTRNALPSLLNENTLTKSGYTWNHLFYDINDYILKETEKLESSKNFYTVIGPLCSNLLHLCVAGSNKGHAYIKCEKITEACLNILNDNRLKSAIGDAYLSLLYKHVLSNDHYVHFITPTTWEGLLSVCLSSCVSNNSKLDVFIKLRLVWLVTKNATNCCQFVIPLRDSLSSFRKCIIKVIHDKKAQEIVLEIMIILMETLSTECRQTMCEFTEDILNLLINFYDHNMDQKKKTLLYKLLQNIISIHHPMGRHQHEEGSLAHSWTTWNKHLYNILELVTTEINNMQKCRKPTGNILLQCKHFSYVAASVYFQIFKLLDQPDQDIPTAKKRKTSLNKNKSFNDFIKEFRQHHVQWVIIIQMYVQYFGSSITLLDYSYLLESLECVISNANSSVPWETFGDLACLTLSNLCKLPDYKCTNCSDTIILLWNACVRNCAVSNVAHEATHTIIQSILRLDILKYQAVQPLITLYFEKGMPVSNHSVRTLNHLFHKYYSKCSYLDGRMKFLNFIVHDNITAIDVNIVQETLLRLLTNENIKLSATDADNDKDCNVYDVLFGTIDKNILFSDFEYEMRQPPASEEHNCVIYEINTEVNKIVEDHLELELNTFMRKLKDDQIGFLEYIKITQVVLAYLNIVLKIQFKTDLQIEMMHLFTLLNNALENLFVTMIKKLKSDISTVDKIALVQCVQNMLIHEYEPLFNNEIRKHVHQDWFYCINDILKQDISTEDIENMAEDEMCMGLSGLKHSCICLLAAFCRHHHEYRDDLIKCILDRETYNFDYFSDIECAYNCIKLLIDPKVEECPLDQIFTFMRAICKDLFRNSKASLGLLRILLQILDRVWSHKDTIMRQNCIIMIRSYLQRCIMLYYPPHVATLVYDCAARLLILNGRQDSNLDEMFKDILIDKTRADIHNIRLNCCYLLKDLFVNFSDTEIDNYVDSQMDIFTMNVADNKPSVLLDEAINRTATVLHSCYVLVKARPSLIQQIIVKNIYTLNEKSLDGKKIKRVLNIITNGICSKSIEVFLNDNLLHILCFWFDKYNNIDALPLSLFGFASKDEFIEKHLSRLIAAETFWRKKGDIGDSDIIKYVKTNSDKSLEDIVEACYCNLITLCLPYIVIEKYKLEHEKKMNFKNSYEYANKMFHQTRQILKNEKWVNVFVENMAELLLMSATYMCDHLNAKTMFNIHASSHMKNYTYSKNTFLCILRYFEELIDGNVMQYLCENQPLAILNIIFNLWTNVVNENILEIKVLHLYAYITFIENVPLGSSADNILYNFVCNGLAHAISGSKNKNELKILAEAMRIVLVKVMPTKKDILRKSVVSKAVSILTVKKEEGDSDICNVLLSYLRENMAECFNENVDVIDFIDVMSQGRIEGDIGSTTKDDFNEKLKKLALGLSHASHDSLTNMFEYLKANKKFVNVLSKDLNIKGFSENCETSIMHKIISSLCNILKNSTDNKIIVEACNCLAEIGCYDLKTLMTVPPPVTRRIVSVKPDEYFAEAVLSALSDVLFDDSTDVSNKIVKAIGCLLKFRDGKMALESMELDKQIVSSLSSPNADPSAEFKINASKFESFGIAQYWIPYNDENHIQWITRMSNALLGILSAPINYLDALLEVCAAKPKVCEQIIPALTGLLLSSSSDVHTKLIGQQIIQFLQSIWDDYFDRQPENPKDRSNRLASVLNNDKKMIVQYVLNIVNFIRLQRKHYTNRRSRNLETYNYLRLNYDHVAWAATVLDQNMAAIYYGELWALSHNNGVPPSSPEATANLDGGENIQKIFRKCYMSIGEMDALDGCGTTHLTSEDEKRKYLINTGQYSEALFLHDIALSCSSQLDPVLQYGAVTSMYKFGMHHLALQYMKSIPENDAFNDIRYDCLSSLGDWSDFVDIQELEEKSKIDIFNPNSTLKAYRYACLKDCLNIQFPQDFKTRLDKPIMSAKQAVSKLCQRLNMENCQNVYKSLVYLHLFRDIEDYFSVRCGKLSLVTLLKNWSVGSLPPFKDFKHLENIVSQRSVILEHAAKNYTSYLSDMVNLQLQYAELSLLNEKVELAQRLLTQVKKLQPEKKVALVESRISWRKGHKDIALSLLRGTVSDETTDVKQTAMSLRQYGLWMAECKRENARHIINKYLEQSLKVLNRSDDQDTRLKVYYDIAKFADSEYKQVVSYMNSAEFENKVKCVENMKGTASSLKSSQQSLSRDEKKALLTNDGFKRLEEAEINNIKLEKNTFLELAMRYYLLSLKQSDDNNLSVFRVIALWFENPDIDILGENNETLGELFEEIPSWKFVDVLPQLAPRLCSDNSTFAEYLKNIIKRCALEHPHHTLPILFNLKNSEKDKCILNSSKDVGNKSGPRSGKQEPRVAVADSIVKELADQNDVLAVVISQMEQICDATISFAYYVPLSKEKNRQPIPRAEPLSKLKHLDSIPIPTVTTPISKNGNYDNLITLRSFEGSFVYVGGINYPKKVVCDSSDGKKRILLIKGNDDLRQDAVMQQVFNIVNTLLEANPITNRNNLLIRTYKVVPMSRCSGVLEWCEGTMPIGEYLNKAHPAYRPTDITPLAARTKLKECHDGRKSNREKLMVFNEVLNVFKPVFHYFFTEHYLDPVTWYERRLAYTRSVATSSMVGYIMGLGDRHVQNILIDTVTAEVVHIDFGIAFDQGKTLPTPETIPFRLTQDIIAGFGCSGVEGIFRRSCEKTLQLLRDNQETLITILEVLLCDPLYMWIVSSTPRNKHSKQAGSGGLAERALMAVNSKLCGTEGGVAGGMSVPGQVAALVNTATDRANLCRLFPGWQPYL